MTQTKRHIGVTAVDKIGTRCNVQWRKANSIQYGS